MFLNRFCRKLTKNDSFESAKYKEEGNFNFYIFHGYGSGFLADPDSEKKVRSGKKPGSETLLYLQQVAVHFVQFFIHQAQQDGGPGSTTGKEKLPVPYLLQVFFPADGAVPVEHLDRVVQGDQDGVGGTRLRQVKRQV